MDQLNRSNHSLALHQIHSNKFHYQDKFLLMYPFLDQLASAWAVVLCRTFLAISWMEIQIVCFLPWFNLLSLIDFLTLLFLLLITLLCPSILVSHTWCLVMLVMTPMDPRWPLWLFAITTQSPSEYYICSFIGAATGSGRLPCYSWHCWSWLSSIINRLSSVDRISICCKIRVILVCQTLLVCHHSLFINNDAWSWA